MKLLVTVLAIYLMQLGCAFGQTSDDVRRIIENASVYTIAEINPAFPGGIDSLKSYLKRNVVYPELYRKFKYKDRIFVKFVVEKDGCLTNLNFLTEGKKEFMKEAQRVIENMPKWNPGMQDGKPLRVYFTLPVKFCPEGCAGW